MNNIIGNQIKYILIRTNTTEQEGQESVHQAMFYNQYDNTLTTAGDINQATKFAEDKLETVQSLAAIQNSMAQLLNRPFEYSVVKEEIDRTEVE